MNLFPLLLTVQELLLVERKSRWLEGTIRRIGVHNEGPPYPHQLLLQVLLDSSAAERGERREAAGLASEGVTANHGRGTLLYFRKSFTAQPSSQYLSIVSAK